MSLDPCLCKVLSFHCNLKTDQDIEQVIRMKLSGFENIYILAEILLGLSIFRTFSCGCNFTRNRTAGQPYYQLDLLGCMLQYTRDELFTLRHCASHVDRTERLFLVITCGSLDIIVTCKKVNNYDDRQRQLRSLPAYDQLFHRPIRQWPVRRRHPCRHCRDRHRRDLFHRIPPCSDL